MMRNVSLETLSIFYICVNLSFVDRDLSDKTVDLFCGFCSDVFPLPLGALERLRHLCAALPGPSV